MCLSAPEAPAAVAPAKAIVPENTEITTMDTPTSPNDALSPNKKGKKGLRADLAGLQIPVKTPFTVTN
jgi:hypothetical protein